MKREGSSITLVAALSAIAGLLFVAIVAGTLWAFASGNARPSARRGARGNPSAVELASGTVGGKAVFSDIGTVRLALRKTAKERNGAKASGEEPLVTVILTPFIPYDGTDVPFREELVVKNRSLRAAIREWFSSRSLEEIESLGEPAVKEALTREINSLLVLGSIETVWFTDYLAIE